MADCTHCGQPIKLVPSAAERAAKYGGQPGDYTRLFTAHGTCVVEARERDTRELIKRLANKQESST